MQTGTTLALVGGGNMAHALASGLAGRLCRAEDIHVIEPDAHKQKEWRALGATVAATADHRLAGCRVWFFAVKPQIMAEVVTQCRPYVQRDTLVISIAAGIPARALARWLGSPGAPYQRIVRCMPNTPALIAAGISGLAALPGVDPADRELADRLMQAVGDTVWVAGDAELDAVTAVSGSGPAYVFLFLEALSAAGQAQGLTAEVADQLALATFRGAAELAGISPDAPAVLRQRVTSKGGTTAAALDVFDQLGFKQAVQAAVAAANSRAQELAREYSGD